MKIRVGLLDDHGILLEGLESLLRQEPDIEVVFTAQYGFVFLEKLKSHPLDIAIIDIGVPLERDDKEGIQQGKDGLEVAYQIKLRDTPDTPAPDVLILSTYDDARYIRRAMLAEVKGYILKDNTSEELVAGIRAVYRGKTFRSPTVQRKIEQGFLLRKEVHFTTREKDVLRLISQGKSGPEIATSLKLKPTTITHHKRNIMSKLEIHTNAELVVYGRTHNYHFP